MTIRELYKWAKEKRLLDSPIYFIDHDEPYYASRQKVKSVKADGLDVLLDNNDSSEV